MRPRKIKISRKGGRKKTNRRKNKKKKMRQPEKEKMMVFGSVNSVSKRSLSI